MGYSPPLIRHTNRAIRATVIFWVRYLRSGTGVVVFQRRAFRLYLVPKVEVLGRDSLSAGADAPRTETLRKRKQK